jgi:hypothetical protein
MSRAPLRILAVRICAGAAAVVPLTALPACAGPADSPRTSRTYALGARTVRPDERAVRLRPAVDGDTSFTVIGVTSALPSLAGSHADVKARGRYVRIRLVVVNDGRTTALLDVMRQRLVTADGQDRPPDREAMLVKRQPLRLEVGAAVRVEFDFWYDVPVSAPITALRLYGGATLTDLKDERGTELRLP